MRPIVYQRRFPNTNQDIPFQVHTVVNQSRVVFGGGRGTVVVTWRGAFRNIFAGVTQDCRASILTTASVAAENQWIVDELAANTDEKNYLVRGVFVNPSAGQNAELRVFRGPGNMRIVARAQVMTVWAFPAFVGAGPLVAFP